MHTGIMPGNRAGELIRAALAIGYTLVSYEDTAAGNHTAKQRDSIQAENIYNVIKQILPPKSWCMRLSPISARSRAPMVLSDALAFKRISGIDR